MDKDSPDIKCGIDSPGTRPIHGPKNIQRTTHCNDATEPRISNVPAAIPDLDTSHVLDPNVSLTSSNEGFNGTESTCMANDSTKSGVYPFTAVSQPIGLVPDLGHDVKSTTEENTPLNDDSIPTCAVGIDNQIQLHCKSEKPVGLLVHANRSTLTSHHESTAAENQTDDSHPNTVVPLDESKSPGLTNLTSTDDSNNTKNEMVLVENYKIHDSTDKTESESGKNMLGVGDISNSNEIRNNVQGNDVPSGAMECIATEETPKYVNTGPVYRFYENIREITGSWNEFQTSKGECFTKGCKWAPDGTCILTNSEDNVLRIFDLPPELHCQETWPASRTLPEMKPVLKMAEGGLIYDYCWYPLMSSWNPLSCCLVSTSQYSPTHMWDAFTGELRATYRAYNQVDEVVSANCVAFDRMGEKLYCGFNNAIRVFNTALPGRKCETRNLKTASISVESQRGLVSCISINPEMQKIYAVGSYLKSIGLYSEPDGSPLCLLEGHTGGVSHLVFSPDGTQLFSGGRKDPEIICWDIRNPGYVLFTLERNAGTNQRIYFDITPDGRHLLSGNSDGLVKAWDLLAPPAASTSQDAVLKSVNSFKAHDDCVNGLSIHQQYSIVATSSGQRHYAEVGRDSSSDSDGSSSPILKRKHIWRENSIKLWWAGNTA